MTSNDATTDEPTVERRSYLQAIGAVGVVGASGLASAGDGEETIDVVETEPLPAEEAQAEFDVVTQNEQASTLIDFMDEGELELQPQDVYAEALVTESDAINARNPVAVRAPFEVSAGPEYGYGVHSAVVMDGDDGQRVTGAGVGTAVEQFDGEYHLRSYEMEDATPVVSNHALIENGAASTWYDPSTLVTTRPFVYRREFFTKNGELWIRKCERYICKYDPNPKTNNHKWCCCKCTTYPMPEIVECC